MKIMDEFQIRQSSAGDFGLHTQLYNDMEYIDGDVLTPLGLVSVMNQPIKGYAFLLRFDMVFGGYHFGKSYSVKKLYSKNGLIRLASNFAKQCANIIEQNKEKEQNGKN